MTSARWAYAALIAATLFAYRGSLQIGLVYDDHKVVANNPLIRGFDALPTYFSPDYYRFSGDPVHWRPVATLSHLLVYQLGGLEPWVHHAANLLLHLGNALALLWLLRRVVGRGAPALLGALAFALHPAISEAVLCVTFRRDALVLAGLFASLACARAAARAGGPAAAGWLALLAVAQALAIGSKETAAVFPALVPLLVVWLAEPLDLAPARARRTALAAAAVCAAAVGAYLAFRLHLEARSAVLAGALPAPAFPERVALAVTHLRVYLQLLAVPWPLGLERPSTWLGGGAALATTLGALTCAALALAHLAPGARGRAALAWVLLPLLPVLVFVPGATAERYLYVPAGGFALGVALGVAWLSTHLPDRRWAVFATLPLLALEARLVHHQVTAWREPITLWRQTAEHFPESFRTHVGLASELARAGELAEAEAHLRRALVLYPASDAALHGLAQVLGRRGDVAAAKRAFRELLARRPVDEARVAEELAELLRNAHPGPRGGR